jgi:hypothetical protein
MTSSLLLTCSLLLNIIQDSGTIGFIAFAQCHPELVSGSHTGKQIGAETSSA